MDVMKTLFVILFFCVTGSKSYPGRQFLLSFPQNYINNNGNVEIVLTCVATTDVQVNLTFHAPDSFVQPETTTFNLAPDERYVISLSAGIRMPTGSVIDTRCVEVISAGDITVVVFNRQGSNGDAYMALPISLLGQVYVSANYDNRDSGSASFIVITAPFNDSKISIRVPDFKNIVSFMFDDRLFSSEETIVVTLSAYQVLQLQVKDDLTGTHIVSDKPISVLSGVNRTSIYQKTCRSHVMDSLPPVRRLGYQYVTVTEPKYREPTVYRIVATEVATRVEIGTDTIILNKTGDFHESVITPNNFYFIQSSKPVLVAQLSTSYYNNTYTSGDPSMMILTPLQAARDSYTFSVVNYYSYKVYVTIVINSSDVSGLRLNNKTVTTTWTAVTGKPNLVVGEVMITTSLADSQKVANGNGGKFLAYIQGVISCEGYSFGLTFQEMTNTPACTNSLSIPGDLIDNDCDGKTDEEVCCIDKTPIDDDGDGLIDEDCSVPEGFTRDKKICCGDSNEPSPCPVFRRTAHPTPQHGRKFSLPSEEYITDSRVSCVLKCVSDVDCWGVNYKATPGGTTIDNCQMLKGVSNGLIQDSNWKYYPIKMKDEFN